LQVHVSFVFDLVAVAGDVVRLGTCSVASAVAAASPSLPVLPYTPCPLRCSINQLQHKFFVAFGNHQQVLLFIFAALLASASSSCRLMYLDEALARQFSTAVRVGKKSKEAGKTIAEVGLRGINGEDQSFSGALSCCCCYVGQGIVPQIFPLPKSLLVCRSAG
jgi:hypothetical protein